MYINFSLMHQYVDQCRKRYKYLCVCVCFWFLEQELLQQISLCSFKGSCYLHLPSPLSLTHIHIENNGFYRFS